MQRPPYDENTPQWLIPELSYQISPGKILGGYIRTIKPTDQGGNKKYAAFAVESLPSGANAGGARPGVVNTVATVMPAEIASHATGHAMRDISSLWDYLDAQRAVAQAAMSVLAGFKPFPWGQLGKGPVHASLAALDLIGVGMDKLDKYIDTIYQLDSPSPPHFRVGGSLRPMVCAAFASQVMYYEERFSGQEMPNVLARMRDAVGSERDTIPRGGGGGGGNVALDGPHKRLIDWSKILKQRFVTDNQHLLGGPGADSSSQATKALEHLGNSVVDMTAEITSLRSELKSVKAQLTALSHVGGATAAAGTAPLSPDAPAAAEAGLDDGASTGQPMAKKSKKAASSEFGPLVPG